MLNKEPYKYEQHSFNVKMLHWLYCGKCGLVMMKNDFSQWHQRMGCNASDHPNHANERLKHSIFKEK